MAFEKILLHNVAINLRVLKTNIVKSLIKALRIDQAGQSTFPEFLKASFEAGVVSYNVDFEMRVVTYYGVLGESYSENYPAVEIG